MAKRKPIRILAFDISLTRPGAAVVEVNKGKAKVINLSNCQTVSTESYASRSQHIKAWAYMFIRKNQTKSKIYDVIVREKYSGKFNNYSIFSAWSAVDRALSELGLHDSTAPIPQQTVKKQVCGNGRAEKEELAEAVRELTGYRGEFQCDDESDAVAVALCWAIENGKIKPKR